MSNPRCLLSGSRATLYGATASSSSITNARHSLVSSSEVAPPDGTGASNADLEALEGGHYTTIERILNPDNVLDHRNLIKPIQDLTDALDAISADYNAAPSNSCREFIYQHLPSPRSKRGLLFYLAILCLLSIDASFMYDSHKQFHLDEAHYKTNDYDHERDKYRMDHEAMKFAGLAAIMCIVGATTLTMFLLASCREIIRKGQCYWELSPLTRAATHRLLTDYKIPYTNNTRVVVIARELSAQRQMLCNHSTYLEASRDKHTYLHLLVADIQRELDKYMRTPGVPVESIVEQVALRF